MLTQFSLLPVKLLPEFLHVAEEVVLKGLHLALGNVLASRFAVRPALAEAVALMPISSILIQFSLILLDGLDEIPSFLGEGAILFLTFVFLRLFVFEGGVGNDSGLEFVEAELV